MNKYQYFIGAFIFILLITGGVISLFVTFYKRKNQLLKEKLEEKLAAQKREHQSELNALRSQLNPHFVHNSLNAIQYYIQRNEVEISEDYLTKFSKLMRLFFEYSRKKTITLKEEVSFLKNYLQIEKLRFEDKINYAIEIDSDLDLESTYIPSMLLQPMLENAVNHGIFHKPDKGTIQLIFKKSDIDDAYSIHIIDDGIGIIASKKLHAASTGAVKAHSSTVIEERLAILNESKEWMIQYSINDRSTKSANSGTEIQLEIQNKEAL